MHDPVEHRGEWWVPGSEDRWPGSFVYAPDTGIELSITAASTGIDFPTRDAFPMLHGQTVDGKAVTLLDAPATSSRLHMPGGIEAKLRPSQAFIGRVWFDPDEPITFNRLILRLDAIAEWAGLSGFDLKYESGDRFTLGYEVPDSVDIAEVAGVRVRLSFSASSKPLGRPMTRFNVAQDVHLELVADEARPYEDLDEVVRQIRNFFMFATRDRVPLLSMDGELEIDTEEARQRKQRVRILDRREIGAEPRRRQPEPHRMLFTLAENGTGSDSALGRWLELSELLGPVFDLYLVSLFQPRIFLELQFLSLAQAVESLHSRRLDAKDLPTEDHRERVRRVVEAAPEELREWTRGRLEGANRKSFRDGLLELIDRLPPVTRDAIHDPNAIAEKTRITRNYLTHWNKDLKDDAAEGQELVALTWALRAILEALLLGEIGFDENQTEELLKRNPDYLHDLRSSFGTLNGSEDSP